ncbi:hypothetical protein EWM64_g4952, partial [Hericium alpestre]
ASVLAAAAARPPLEGRELGDGSPTTTTRIERIANQRVKECNRIRAMIDQLAKFGVETKELDDGLEVYGKPIPELKEGASVHCYDDHRVAMAFSVLGAAVKDTIIEEKRCVEKTWPNWWDDLENKIGLKVEGVELPSAASQASASKPAQQDAAASVVVIGMRGSGKTHIGSLASSVLDWPFIDADEYFVEKNQQDVREYVQANGWPAFRAAEMEILQELLDKFPTKHVLSLGGGIVETPTAREILKAYAQEKGPVVHIVREIDEVLTYLGEEESRPAYGEPIVDVFKRRQPWFAECSSHEFINYTGVLTRAPSPTEDGALPAFAKSRLPFPTCHTHTSRDEIDRFFGHITGQRPNLSPNLVDGKRSFFLSLTFPDINPALQQIDELAVGVDALELRVDLLRAPQQFNSIAPVTPPRAYVAEQIAALRRKTSIPIVFTVRTVSQGGSFPDKAVNEAFDLFDLALRVGVEYVDVELTWPEKKIADLVKRKGHSQIIASYHDWTGGFDWSSKRAKETYGLAAAFGDIVKLVGSASDLQDNLDLQGFRDRITVGRGAKPLIAINMGTAGQLSRILNPTFTPVTHPLLPVPAAPGQLSLVQIHQALNLIGQLPAKKFYLFGNPIQHSQSPTLHNTAFAALGLPHTYALLETDDVAEDGQVLFVMTSPDFGGASVTIPFKRNIMPYLDELSPAADAIGAVNTVIPKTRADGSQFLYGDNTDWQGIVACVRARLPASAIDAALVIGAGGTARAAIFALHKLGARRIYLFNRTRTKAEELVGVIPGARVQLVDALGEFDGPSPSVIVSTVPASATTLESDESGMYLPASMLPPEGGVVVDMAYRPAETPLLQLAKAARAKWETVMGVEVLLEQGYRQFELWTGRRCPRDVVARKVWKAYSQCP